jgi:hypothetical protein
MWAAPRVNPLLCMRSGAMMHISWPVIKGFRQDRATRLSRFITKGRGYSKPSGLMYLSTRAPSMSHLYMSTTVTPSTTAPTTPIR